MILNEKLFKEFNEEFDADGDWFYTYQALKNVGSVQDYSEEFEFEDEAINFAKDHDYDRVVRYYYPIIDNSEETWDFIDYVNYGHPKYNEEIWNRAYNLDEAYKKKVKESIDYTDENYLYKPYWYLTRHGMGPGSVPAKMSVWTWFETPEGTYFASSKVISKQELEEYEIVEKQPNLEDIPEKSRIDIQNFLETPLSYADSLIETKGFTKEKVKKSSVRNINVEPGYHEWIISVNNIPYYSFGDITDILDIYTNAEDFANDELENFKELSFQYFNGNEKIDSFTDDAQKIGKLTPEENANVYYGIIDMYNYYKGLTEDIEKTKLENRRSNNARLSYLNKDEIIFDPDEYKVKYKGNKRLKESKRLVETGEWEDDEEGLLWKQQLLDLIHKYTTFDNVELEDVKGFDKYQGPYVYDSGLEFWVDNEAENCLLIHNSNYNLMSDLGWYRICSREDFEKFEQGNLEPLQESLDLREDRKPSSPYSHFKNYQKGFKESIKLTNAEKIYDKLQKDLNKLGYQIGLNRRTGDIQINQRVFKENGRYKSGTITTKEALKDAIDLANEYGLKTSVEVFLHKPILTIHTTELFNPEVTREALNNNLKVKDESLYQTDSVSGNKMTFEVSDDGKFIVKDGEKVILNTKVVDVQDTRNQIKSMQDIEVLQEDLNENLDDEVAKEVEMIFSSADETFPNRMLSRLKSDFKYILGAVKDNAEKDNESVSLNTINKHLWFHDIDKQAALMKEIYERLDEKPEDLTLQDIDNFVTETKQLLNNKKAIEEDLEREIEDLNENPGDEEKIDPTAGLETVLNDLINDENEAINGYNSAIVNFEVEGRGDLTQVFRDIIKDEQNHIGNLQKVLNEINPDTLKNIQDGQKEAEETLQSDSNSETEETNE